jgi:hypothetical protein
MEQIARYIVIAGIVLIIIGGLVFLAARIGFPLGRLPGDIRIERGNGTFYFPLASSIIISILLTVLLNIIVRLIRK